MNAQGGPKVTDHSSAEIACSLTQMIPFISQMPFWYSIRLRYVYSQRLIQKKKSHFVYGSCSKPVSGSYMKREYITMRINLRIKDTSVSRLSEEPICT